MSKRWKTRKKNGILADQRRAAFLSTDEKLNALMECIKSNDQKGFMGIIQESVDREIEYRNNNYHHVNEEDKEPVIRAEKA